MGTMIQIRNVPEDLHRDLKARAALAGQSLSEYLLMVIRRAATHATPEELRSMLARREPVDTETAAAALIREARGPLP